MGLAKVLRSRQSTTSIFLASRGRDGQRNFSLPTSFPRGSKRSCFTPPVVVGSTPYAGALMGLTLVEPVLTLAL